MWKQVKATKFTWLVIESLLSITMPKFQTWMDGLRVLGMAGVIPNMTSSVLLLLSFKQLVLIQSVALNMQRKKVAWVSAVSSVREW